MAVDLDLFLSFVDGQGVGAANYFTYAEDFDQNFVDFLKDKPYPVIDMRDIFAADYRNYNIDIHTYLNRYYNGHHSPAGNFFTAWSIKKRIVEWLSPTALPYR